MAIHLPQRLEASGPRPFSEVPRKASKAVFDLANASMKGLKAISHQGVILEERLAIPC